eukprot:5256074-Heterocapsa_arctica.AAC.1
MGVALMGVPAFSPHIVAYSSQMQCASAPVCSTPMCDYFIVGVGDAAAAREAGRQAGSRREHVSQSLKN